FSLSTLASSTRLRSSAPDGYGAPSCITFVNCAVNRRVSKKQRRPGRPQRPSVQRNSKTPTMSRLLAVAFILFCFEVGLFLIFAPWLPLWESNLLLDYVTYLRPLVLNNVFRAAVTILGAMDVFIGL